MVLLSLTTLSSTSNLMLGVIEELDIHDLQHSPEFYPSISTGIDDLSMSIKEKGLLHPITVRAKEEKKEGVQRHFEIVAGNRRCLACKALGWRKILCHIVELTDREAFEISLVENIQRRTLSPLEEAQAFRMYVSELGWGGISDLAAKIGKSTSYVDRRLGLLNLPNKVLKKVLDSSLYVSVAEELIPLHNKSQQSKLADMASKKRLSLKQVRELMINNNQKEDSVYDTQGITTSAYIDDISVLDKRAQRCFDKSIVVLKVAMNKISDIMETIEDNWIIYEILMQHRNVLHTEIDLLMKQKKKV